MRETVVVVQKPYPKMQLKSGEQMQSLLNGFRLYAMYSIVMLDIYLASMTPFGMNFHNYKNLSNYPVMPFRFCRVSIGYLKKN